MAATRTLLSKQSAYEEIDKRIFTMHCFRLMCVPCMVFIAVTNAAKVPSNGELTVTPSTPACSSAGGMCTEPGHCPEGRLAPKRGLCSGKGASLECCLDVYDCRKKQNQCMPVANCGTAPRDRLGICRKDEVCCILLT